MRFYLHSTSRIDKIADNKVNPCFPRHINTFRESLWFTSTFHYNISASSPSFISYNINPFFFCSILKANNNISSKFFCKFESEFRFIGHNYLIRSQHPGLYKMHHSKRTRPLNDHRITEGKTFTIEGIKLLCLIKRISNIHKFSKNCYFRFKAIWNFIYFDIWSYIHIL